MLLEICYQIHPALAGNLPSYSNEQGSSHQVLSFSHYNYISGSGDRQLLFAMVFGYRSTDIDAIPGMNLLEKLCGSRVGRNKNRHLS